MILSEIDNWGESPRYMPVYLPIPRWSGELTIATLDSNGNVAIKTQQPKFGPEPQKIHWNYESFTSTRRNNMTYLNVDRQALINDLKQSVAEIRFQKKDGSTRILKCTLQRGYLPEEYQNKINEAANKDGNQEILAVWDIESKAWRSFRLDWVYSIQQLDY